MDKLSVSVSTSEKIMNPIPITNQEKHKLLIIDADYSNYISANDFYFEVKENTIDVQGSTFNAIIIKHTAIIELTIKRIKELRNAYKNIPIICITDIGIEELNIEFIKAGADDVFLLHTDSNCRLKRSILYLCEKAKNIIVQEELTPTSSASLELTKLLTAREKEIIEELAKGKTNKDISKAVKLSPATVRNHLYEIFKKLKVNNRTRAVSIWLENNSSYK